MGNIWLGHLVLVCTGLGVGLLGSGIMAAVHTQSTSVQLPVALIMGYLLGYLIWKRKV